MDRIRQLFLLLALVTPLHMLEQFAFGEVDLARIRSGLAVYNTWFPNTDQAMVALLTVTAAGFLFVAYGLLAGGVLRLATTAFVSVVSLTEGHHMIGTFVRGVYDPGVLTATFTVAISTLLLVAIHAEYRRSRIAWADVVPAYQTW